jgi:molybdopterin biosynthesis enzyme
VQVATAIKVTIKASDALLNSGAAGVGEADVVLVYTFPVPAAMKPLFVIVK